MPTPLLGQNLALELIERALRSGRIAPAYLFVGPDGVGKAIAARYFAALLLLDGGGRVERGNHPDLLWIEPTYKKGERLLSRADALAEGSLPRSQPQIRLEQVRAVTQFLGRPPVEGDRRVVVIENAQALGDGAANALLKTLEEPGAGHFILTTPEVRYLLTTVVSRCQKIPFVRLADRTVIEILGSRQIEVPSEILAMAEGSPGRALQLAEWLAAVPPEVLTLGVHWVRDPVDLRTALAAARTIEHSLAIEAQITLVDYLQHLVWSQGQTEPLWHLEALRGQLSSYIAPRLAWEVALARRVGSVGDPGSDGFS